MNKNELNKIREMSDVELNKKLDELKEDLFNLRFQHAINQLDNPMRLKAHDENNECRVGDRVEMMETRHLSKDKCWRVTRIIEKAK